MKSFEVLAKASDQGRAKEFKKFLAMPSGKAERALRSKFLASQAAEPSE